LVIGPFVLFTPDTIAITQTQPGRMFKFLRIAILLLILATVAQEAWLSRSRAVSWQDPLRVAIYPISGDDSPATVAYLRGLRPTAFESMETFFAEEAQRHDVKIAHPVSIALAAPLATVPPQPPRSGNVLENVIWSLRMRWWAWRNDALPGAKPQVRLFVVFYDPARQDHLTHSVGVRSGMIGLINAFASQGMAGSNAVIIAHEFLHTLGATDKYDPATNQPRYPDGYAEPERQPRLPQTFAEIMGGRIPITESRSDIPESINLTLIGPATAAEIGWVRQ
jgi:hypothetical protein